MMDRLALQGSDPAKGNFSKGVPIINVSH